MKEIDSQLYGYSYELNRPTTETDGTTCYAVDTGTVFFAFGGYWYEQREAHWCDVLGGGGSSSLPEVSAADNGDVLAVVDGAWGKSDPPSSLPSVSAADNGDVLTVVEGAWAKAEPSGGGGGVMVLATVEDPVITATWNEVVSALQAGILCTYVAENSVPGSRWTQLSVLTTAYYSEEDGYVIGGISVGPTGEISGGPILVAESADGVLDTV